MQILAALILLLIGGAAYGELQWVSPWNKPESEPSVVIFDSDRHGFTAEVTISGFYTEPVNNEAGEFQRIRLTGRFESTTMKVGSPEIPQISRLIYIPSTAIAEAKVISGEYIDLKGYSPFPFQTPSRDGEGPHPFAYSESFYNSAGFYPDELVDLGEPGVWRHLQVGGVKISPMRYDPGNGVLRVYRSLTVEIEFKPGFTAPFETPNTEIPPQFDRIYHSRLLNYAPSLLSMEETDEEAGVKYLIITPDSAVEVIQPLIELRNAQGLRTEIQTISPAFQTPSNFKAMITSLYLSDGLEYVLMVGDPYLGNPVVPMYYWEYGSGAASYSDSWYTCVVPGGDSDHYPELAIGRFVYSSLLELEHMVDKTMDYLTGYDDSEDWFQQSLLVAHQQDYPLAYTQCKEQIRTFDYNIQTPVFQTIYGGEGGSNIDIVNYINGGSCGLLNYRGHGAQASWPQWSGNSFFTSTQVNAMNNPHRLFIVFDICCKNNDVVNYGGNCLAETFMKADYAAAAIHAAILSSYTEPNHVFDREFYRAIYDDGVTNIGYASNSASVDMINQFGYLGQANFRMYFWQGDPAINIWTHIPSTAEVSAPGSIALGQSSVEITVLVEGLPFPEATVCLQNEAVYAVGFTDASGLAALELDPPPLTVEDIFLTVSGHNLAFLQDTILVIGGFGSLEGFVSSNQTSQPLEGAVVSIQLLGVETETDSTGYYIFTDLPAISYVITAEMEGYIDSTRNVILDSGAVVELNFALQHSECIPDIGEISVGVASGETAEIPFNIANSGDGPLEYTIEITGENAGANLWQRFSFNASSQTGDENIQGVAFDGTVFWITGSGDDENNWLHKFDQEGNYIESLPQPESYTAHGFYDICWDGSHFYGAESGDIICFDAEGNHIGTISTTLNPVKAIAFDPANGHLFIGSGLSNIREIDSAGVIIRSFIHNHDITGLCWWENDPDGFPLYIFSSDPAITISKMNPSTGEEAGVGYIMGMPDDVSGGCWVGDDFNPLYVLFFGVVQGYDADKVKGWQLQRLFDWVTVAPDSGVIPGGGSGAFMAAFDASELGVDVYEAVMLICHNALGGFSEIPITLTVSGAGVASDVYSGNLPREFKLHPNHPNPFNEGTVLEFEVPQTSVVRFYFYDVLGREIAELHAGKLNAGAHRLYFQAEGLASGIYFCRMEAGGFHSVIKMTLLK